MNTEEKEANFPSHGFARLIKYFESTDDIVKLTRAFGLASKVHKGQVFRGEPYINHPLRVALILVVELQLRDPDLASAALVHDATDATPADVSECGDKALAVVRAPHEPKGRPEEREKALEDYFKKITHASKDVRYVKVADKLDSVRAMKGQAQKAAKYREEIEKYVMPLAKGTDDRLAFKLSVALYELK